MPGGGLDFIPVDFYDGNTMHFGEMTVYPSGGLEFYEPEWNRHFALQVLEDPRSCRSSSERSAPTSPCAKQIPTRPGLRLTVLLTDFVGDANPEVTVTDLEPWVRRTPVMISTGPWAILVRRCPAHTQRTGRAASCRAWSPRSRSSREGLSDGIQARLHAGFAWPSAHAQRWATAARRASSKRLRPGYALRATSPAFRSLSGSVRAKYQSNIGSRLPRRLSQ